MHRSTRLRTPLTVAQDCGPDANALQCRDQPGQTRGFVGRLAWPRR